MCTAPPPPARATLAHLAEQIRQIQHRHQAPPVPSGLPALDAALGGGFAGGAIHELVAPADGVAAHSVALRTATQAAGRHKWILYLDTQTDVYLYPPALAQFGVSLGRLLVVRAPRPADALWVCEQALHCRAIAAVVLPLRNLDAYTSRRLQLAAETGHSLGLLIRTDERGGHTFAASRLRFEPLAVTQWPALGSSQLSDRRASNSRRMRVTVLKLREGRPGEPFIVELPDGREPLGVDLTDAPHFVPAHAVSADRAGAARRLVGG